MFNLPRPISSRVQHRICSNNKIGCSRLNCGGKTENEIYTFLTEKYGEWILYKPQFNQQNLVLWILPYLIFLIGGLFIFF